MLSSWIWTLIFSCLCFIPIAYLLLQVLRAWVRSHSTRLISREWVPLPDGLPLKVIGFFHPYCNAGGGGERVLWVAIRALQKRYQHLRFVVYTGDNATKEEILRTAKQRFDIVPPRAQDIEFVFLKRRAWVEADHYPFFTLLGQSLGSLVLGFEALLQCTPDVYVDSMGYAFTLPLFKYVGDCSVACYVHYPTISTDMLDRVAQRRGAFNNASFISRSRVLSHAKLIYYRLFAHLYGVMGNRADVVMVNSSWTLGHINALWRGTRGRVFVVNPPCDVNGFLKIPLTGRDKLPQSVISVAQFRPEKDHPLQLCAFECFISSLPADQRRNDYRLVLVGSCRNTEDEERVAALRQLAVELKIDDLVDFRLNVSFNNLKAALSEAMIGLHTMWNEHFGIGVVECMAAGTLILAHDSGGPKQDIVVDYNNERTGYLARDRESYAAAMTTIFSLDETTRTNIRKNARESVKRFSDDEFEQKFVAAMNDLFL